jgi:hypothetical protein
MANRLATILAAMLMLLGPAIWNGFPLLQYDTGGYLEPWYSGTLMISRSVVYGLLLTAGHYYNFWPAVMVQALLTLWIATLALRAYDLGGRPLVLLTTIAALSTATALPWLTSVLLTDIFVALAVLALHLLIFRDDRLRGWERMALVAFVAFAAASHSATLAVLTAIVAALLLLAVWNAALVSLGGLRRGATALILSAAIVFAGNFIVAKQWTWTPGGFSLTFGRMLQDGIVHRYLAEHCPDARFKLCEHRDALPHNADDFFWSEDIFDQLGRFEGLGQEMETIAIESLKAYPWMQFQMVARATLQQLAMVRSGAGIVHWVWHTYYAIETYTPAAAPAMHAARQQREKFRRANFDLVNRLHVPATLIAMALLPVILVLALRGRVEADLGWLATTVLLAILANAVVCGTLSGPHDRYGARIAWLATPVVLLAIWRGLLSMLALTSANGRIPADIG